MIRQILAKAELHAKQGTINRNEESCGSSVRLTVAIPPEVQGFYVNKSQPLMLPESHAPNSAPFRFGIEKCVEEFGECGFDGARCRGEGDHDCQRVKGVLQKGKNVQDLTANARQQINDLPEANGRKIN
ncbi:hypothetical protein M0R45_020121 [Rubus argutus]|uniref:Uncharacterized protein n=1 Tax=Rubus argutus TaxID=59490 RepID=A0AAW1X7Z3_RUBAR